MQGHRRQLALLLPAMLLVGGLLWLLCADAPDGGTVSSPVFSSFLSPSVQGKSESSDAAAPSAGSGNQSSIPEWSTDRSSEGNKGEDAGEGVTDSFSNAIALLLVDRDGNPISGASIKIYRRPGFHFANLDASIMSEEVVGDVVSNADGESGFAAKDGYLYDISIEADGFATKRYRLRDPGSKRIVLRRMASVWGHVWNEAGEPLAGVPVELEHARGVLLKAVTTEKGEFEFNKVVPTAATLRIRSPHYQRDWRQIVVEGGIRHYREFFLRSGQSLDVSVLDEAGMPVSGASVDLQELNSGLIVAGVRTDETGIARFNSLDAESSYLVAVNAGTRGLARQVVPARNETGSQSMTVVLETAWTIAGRLVTTDGLAISGAMVVLESDGEEGLFSARHRVTVQTDENGNFVSSSLLPGVNYTILTYHPSFASTVTSGWSVINSEGLLLTMGDPSSVSGTIVGATGEGVTNAMVFLTIGGVEPGTAGSVLVAQTGTDGSYQFTNVGSGEVSLEAVSLLDGGSTGQVSLTLGDGGSGDGGSGGDGGASTRVTIQIKN